MKLAAGLVLALLAALALNVGFFVQHGAANTMVTLSVRHPFASAKLLITNRQWMLGYGAGWVGWGLYVAALALAPLSLVQSVSAGGVGILAILAHRLGTPLTCQERIGTYIAVGGLVLLGLSLTSAVTPTAPALTMTLVVVIAAGAGLAGILVLLARRFRPGALLGCAAGILFGVGDLATKGAVDGSGLLFIPVLAVCTALAFVTLQGAFQRGRGPRDRRLLHPHQQPDPNRRRGRRLPRAHSPGPRGRRPDSQLRRGDRGRRPPGGWADAGAEPGPRPAPDALLRAPRHARCRNLVGREGAGRRSYAFVMIVVAAIGFMGLVATAFLRVSRAGAGARCCLVTSGREPGTVAVLVLTMPAPQSSPQ